MSKVLRLYNTASRALEEFRTEHDTVQMYCCGPTVYNYAHVGNLRTYIFEDVLRRLLRSLGYHVNHVVNITDVGHLTSDADTGEDKMEKGALREGKTVWDIAKYYADAFMGNIRGLNIEEPEVWCKATDHIPEMIALIQQLDSKGFTYRTGDGIYFDTEKFPSYGEFARIEPESIRAGARIEMGDKRSPMDFALWKFSPQGAKRQMEWESPWGRGFPGWHIECSAMSLKYLGQPIDIHCGGSDHVRVHHTNEIAQVEAATGKPFCRFWLHGEFLVVDKGKMAKSGDNFVTLDKLIEKGFDPLSYRFFCFSAHYRSPLSFSWEGIESAGRSLANLKKLIGEIPPAPAAAVFDAQQVDRALVPFWDAVCDDMNLPRAVASVWEFVRDQTISSVDKTEAVRKADAVLGLNLLVRSTAERSVYEISTSGGLVKIESSGPLDNARVQMIAQKVAERKFARKAKDFALADSIRDQLSGQGVAFKDLSDGSTYCEVKK